jgi:hypothetical protein
MDRTTKKAITYAVASVLTAVTWNIYKGLQPDGSPVPFVFPLPGLSASVSSTTATTVMMVDRRS